MKEKPVLPQKLVQLHARHMVCVGLENVFVTPVIKDLTVVK
jgi:hypothetical protein